MSNVAIIAHRGANREAPQNTMPAFVRAYEFNADGIETDVHMTLDGHIVLCHNYTVDKTSDGHGKISDFMLSQLLNMDFSSSVFSEFANVRIPTIDDLLIYLKKTAIKIVNIEVKSNKEKNSEIVAKTIEAAKRYDMLDRLLISSFNPKVLIEAKKIEKSCQTGYLFPSPSHFARDFLLPPLDIAKRIKADAIHPHSKYINHIIVDMAHKAGIKVNVWTVNSMQKALSLIKIGVDGLITDCPFELKAISE